MYFFQTVSGNFGNVLNYCITLPPNRKVFQRRRSKDFMHRALVEVSEDYRKTFTDVSSTSTQLTNKTPFWQAMPSSNLRIWQSQLQSSQSNTESSTDPMIANKNVKNMPKRHQNSKMEFELLGLQWISQPSCGSQNKSIHSLPHNTWQWEKLAGSLGTAPLLGNRLLAKGKSYNHH